MLITKQIKVKITGYNIKYYKSNGYSNISKEQIVEISIDDLYKNSEFYVDVSCDYCGVIFQRRYCDYVASKNRAISSKDACAKCCNQKRLESCLEKYGVDNPAKLDFVKDKMKKTNMERYGYENAFQNKEIQEKMKNTMVKNYGVEYPMQSKEILKRSEQTCLEKYGNKCYLGSEEATEKMKKICLEKYGVEYMIASEEMQNKIKGIFREKYGVEYPLQSDEILKKTHETMYNSGTVFTSAGQARAAELYGCELNTPIGVYFADFYFPEYKIVGEYDGSGHDMQVTLGHCTREEFEQKELRREKYMIENGYKTFRIINPHEQKISDEEYLLLKDKAFNVLLNSKYNVYTYNILTKEENYR